MTDTPGSLAEALNQFQADLPYVPKDARTSVPTKTGGSYSYNYADLANLTRIIMPRLAELGLVWICTPEMQADKFGLAFELFHVSNADESVSGFWPIPLGTPQAMGGAVTYARRYCLCAVTGIAPDDDDDAGQAAEEEYRQQRNRPPEVDEHGAATFAEQTRMVTGPEPGATRHDRVPDEDRQRWEGTDRTPEQVKNSRMGQMFALYALLGIKGNDDDTKQAMLLDLSAMLDKPVTSRADLDLSELTTVCAILRRRVEQQEHT